MITHYQSPLPGQEMLFKITFRRAYDGQMEGPRQWGYEWGETPWRAIRSFKLRHHDLRVLFAEAPPANSPMQIVRLNLKTHSSN